MTVDGLNEEKEEKVGACLEYQADATNDIWTAEGTNALKGVSINCWPLDLPATEMIKIEAPDGFLYEKVGEEYTLAQPSYKACEVNKKQFFLHGHGTSGGLKDKTIIVTHENSGAKDMAKFTVFKIMTETLAMTPLERTRKMLGVGEEVRIIINPAIAGLWSVANGQGKLRYDELSAENIFIATDKEDKSIIQIKIDQESEMCLSVNFNTIPPSDISFVNMPDEGVAQRSVDMPPVCSYVSMNYYANVYLPPDTVNFYNVRYHEGEALSTSSGSYYEAFPQAFMSLAHSFNNNHGMLDTVESGRGSKASEPDTLRFPVIDVLPGASAGMSGETSLVYAEYYSVGLLNQNAYRIKFVTQKISVSFDANLKITVVGTKDGSGWKKTQGDENATPVYQ